MLCPSHSLPRVPLPMWRQQKQLGGGGCFLALTPWLMMQALSAHTSRFTCRMREASSRPKREYKPKPRESFDLGESEQSNGGFPTPKISGKVLEGPCFPRASETGPLWDSPSLLPLPSPLQKGPEMGPGPTSALSPPVCFVCKQLRHLSDLPTSPYGPPAGACVSVPASVYNRAFQSILRGSL